MTQTLEKKNTGGSGFADPWKVIVLNDNHNTFESVAGALSSHIPGCSYKKGMRFAEEIHNNGQATVWSGLQEQAELYWELLKQSGLTMAPLEQ
jgi:ATP-dependent Clp protease adaptor protein ClpS